MKKKVAMTIYVVAAFASTLMFAITDILWDWDAMRPEWFLLGALSWMAFFSSIIMFLSVLQLFFGKTELREKLGSVLRSPFTFVALMVFIVVSGAAVGGLWKIQQHGLFTNSPPLVEEPYAKPNPVGLDGTSTIHVQWKDLERDAVMFDLTAESGLVPLGPLVIRQQKYTPRQAGKDTITVSIYDTLNPPVIKTLIIAVTVEKTEEVQETWTRAIDSLGGGGEPADFRLAQQYLDTLTAQAPEFDQAWMAKGLAYSGSDEWPRALEAFNTYIEIREEAGVQSGALPYLWKAYVQVSGEDMPQALTSFRLATQQDPRLDDLLSMFEQAQTKDERLQLVATGIIQSPNPFLSVLPGPTFPSPMVQALQLRD